MLSFMRLQWPSAYNWLFFLLGYILPAFFYPNWLQVRACRRCSCTLSVGHQPYHRAQIDH